MLLIIKRLLLAGGWFKWRTGFTNFQDQIPRFPPSVYKGRMGRGRMFWCDPRHCHKRDGEEEAREHTCFICGGQVPDPPSAVRNATAPDATAPLVDEDEDDDDAGSDIGAEAEGSAGVPRGAAADEPAESKAQGPAKHRGHPLRHRWV